jgi:hypothetical protein
MQKLAGPLARSPDGVVAAAAPGTGARNGTAIASRMMRCRFMVE